MNRFLVSILSLAIGSVGCSSYHSPGSKGPEGTPVKEAPSDTQAPTAPIQPHTTAEEKELPQVIEQDELLKDIKALGEIEVHLRELGLKFKQDPVKRSWKWENTHFFRSLQGKYDVELVDDMVSMLARYHRSVDRFLTKYGEPFVLRLDTGHLEERQINKRSRQELDAKAQLAEQTYLYLSAWRKENHGDFDPDLLLIEP